MKTDNELINLLKKDDQIAFNELHSRYYRRLLAFATRLYDDEDEAKDCVQEVFIATWKKRHDLEIRTTVNTWFFTLVRYNYRNFVVHQNSRRKYIDYKLYHWVETGECTAETVECNETFGRINKCILALPSKMRDVIILYNMHIYSNKEIADMLGITKKTVKNQTYNAIGILRKSINHFK